MAKAPDQKLAFGKPTISAKLYIAQGPSGWVETFDRKKLDKELQGFFGVVPLDETVELFITQRELSDDKEPTNWHTVVGFLGRLFAVSPLNIPTTVVLAFWGQVEIALKSRGAN